MGTLEAKRAIVVGGGSGIGLGAARLLARDGARVTLFGRTPEKLAAAAASLADEPGPVQWHAGDAMVGADVERGVAVAAEDGALDIAVVVPGGGTGSGILLYDDDQFSREVDLNVRPVFLLLKYAGRAMLKAGGGSFVAVSSTAAAFSFRFLASYGAGKAAVDQIVRVAADELGEAGIRVNGVRPGMTRTPLTEERFFNVPERINTYLALQALPKPGEVADVAHAIRFLAGPESAWTTGQLLTVDGGHTLRAAPNHQELFGLADQLEVLGARRTPSDDAEEGRT